MSDNLYDTGAPKRVIVEHEHRHSGSVQLSRLLECPNCHGTTDKVPCVWCGYFNSENDSNPRSRQTITITPQFQPVEEKKLLK